MAFSKRFVITALVCLITAVICAQYFLTDRNERSNQTVNRSADEREQKSDFIHPVHPSPPSEGYQGSQACLECHADVCNTYQTHPMSFSAQTVPGELTMEDYDLNPGFRSPETHEYVIDKEGGEIFHHEKRLTTENEVIYDKKERVDYAIGSGKRGRSYAINREGLLFMSPISWYSGSQTWDLSPGYQPGHHKQFERRLIDGCIQCHIGLVSKTDGIKDEFDSVPFQDISIGCERCHGPGEKHIQWHSSNAEKSGQDPIVNPVDLTPEAREAVCYQCHLTGEGRILRYGRTEFDFRPGDLIEDIWIVFQQGDRISEKGETQAVSQVEQMHESQCYQKSQGSMGCISCHDPHLIPAEADRVTFYEQRCLECHGENTTECSRPRDSQNQAKESCISCHMPQRQAKSVPHTSLTDHRIIRNKKVGYVQKTSQSDLFSVFREPKDLNAAYDLKRARGFFYIYLAETKNKLQYAQQALELLLPLLNENDSDEELITQIGIAYFLIGNKGKSKTFFELALKLNPRSESALLKLTTICHEEGDYSAGIRYAKRFIEINPWRGQVYGRLVHMSGLTNQFEEGIKYAHRGLEINPASWQLHGWLAQVYQQMGKTELSNQHQKKLQQFRASP
ncbi:multiheme c-type cytochrome [Gimesia aquarii]|uniref:Tetratricopeptide repeat protein n=1 Tax=Gimesia aquarii TaxID=2527964 RepID=A0A517W121_9PLAN|nr:multiheme c-type cytochrome [Gimesia aquarii]QDT98952.1 Tetratricopeptide repeat protein [Gimesia aquarii]